MASITASAPPTPQLPSTPAQEMEKSSVHEEDSLPSDDGDEPLDVDQDDVQSIIQPALSPMATRLTSPKTPAAEKAAAMENLPGGGLFSVKEGTVADYSDQGTPTSSAIPVVRTPIPRPQAAAALQTRQNRGLSLSHLPPSFSQASRFPSPWQSGPKEFVVECQTSPKPTLSAVFGQGRHRRSFSGGPDALKRIREALPSISLPSFFSGPSSAKSASFDTKLPTQSGDGAAESKPVPSMTKSATFGSQSVNRDSAAGSMSLTGQASASSRPPSSVAFRPRAIRRSTSDESMLYHSLSRVSSLGDDDRWNSTREQKNSRLKAITDSWDRPSFKMPQMSQLPNILPAPLKRNSLLGSETSETTPTGAARPGVISENVSDLDRALESLTGDIVVLGGYRGSVLRSTRTNRQVWVPVKVGLNIRKVNLEVGLDPEDEQRMEETIYASGMLQNIGPVDISRRLFKRLRECDNARTGKLRVWDFGYDWRLSPHLLSQKLVSFIEKLPSNQGNGNAHERGATVIAHSLGGLITRHAVNTRPEIFKGVVYAGTPQRCINILGPLRNGDAVLFNEKVLTAAVNFSLRTTFVFLPEDGFCFINKNTGEEYPIDFYNASEWAKHALSPCIEPSLPAYNTRSTLLGSFSEFSGRLPTPLRSRGNSAASEPRPPPSPKPNLLAEATRKAELAHDRSLAPQIGTLSSDSSAAQAQQSTAQRDLGSRSRYMAYLSRTLAETKNFRAETYHRPEHTENNAYPPLAVIYGKEIPTVWAVAVSSREAIPCADVYDDLVFRSGDGVVLAKEAMLPEGYELARGGRVSTDRGHITMLGDLEAVGRALQAIIRGRQKGIGLGGGTPRGIPHEESK